jgi:hypothetical protein
MQLAIRYTCWPEACNLHSDLSTCVKECPIRKRSVLEALVNPRHGLTYSPHGAPLMQVLSVLYVVSRLGKVFSVLTWAYVGVRCNLSQSGRYHLPAVMMCCICRISCITCQLHCHTAPGELTCLIPTYLVMQWLSWLSQFRSCTSLKSMRSTAAYLKHPTRHSASMSR